MSNLKYYIQISTELSAIYLANNALYSEPPSKDRCFTTSIEAIASITANWGEITSKFFTESSPIVYLYSIGADYGTRLVCQLYHNGSHLSYAPNPYPLNYAEGGGYNDHVYFRRQSNTLNSRGSNFADKSGQSFYLNHTTTDASSTDITADTLDLTSVTNEDELRAIITKVETRIDELTSRNNREQLIADILEAYAAALNEMPILKLEEIYAMVPSHR